MVSTVVELMIAIVFKGAMQEDFDDLSPIIKKILRQTFCLLFSSKECQNIT